MNKQQEVLNYNYESEEIFSKPDDFNQLNDQDFSNLNREDYPPPQFYAQRISQEGEQGLNDFIRGDNPFEQNQFLTQYNYNEQYNNNYPANEVISNNQKNIQAHQNTNNQQNLNIIQIQQCDGSENNKNQSYTASSTCDYLSSDYYNNQSLSESSHSNYQSNAFRPSNNLTSILKNQNYQMNINQYQNRQQNSSNFNQNNYGSSPEHFSENSTLGHTPQYVTDYNSNQNSNGIDDDDIDQEEGSDKNNLNQLGSSKIKKNIAKKKYEPLYDNNQIFRYEDDPVEYKKARKRIQNRQSARKVRSIKKNQTENLEMNVDQLKQENQDLKVQVANLSAQNKRLLDEVEYFRRMYGNIIQSYHQESNNNEVNGNEYKNDQDPSSKNTINHQSQERYLPVTNGRINSKLPYGQNQQLFILVVISCILVMSYSSTSYDNQVQTKVNAFFSIDEMKNITKTISLESQIKQIVQDTIFYDSWKIIGWTIGIIAYLTYATLTIYKNFKSKISFNKNKQKSN